MSRLSEFFNEITNDGRIFSLEDVVDIPQEESNYYQKALNYQYDKIGFPTDKVLQGSSDVVYVNGYTKGDGTEVRAHYRSKNGHKYSDSNKRVMTNPKEEKARIEELAKKIVDKGEMTGGASKVEKAFLRSPMGPFGQNFATKQPIIASNFEKNKNLSKEYYRISLTGGKSIDKIDTQNMKCRVEDIMRTNKDLYNHIKGIEGNRQIKDGDLVIVPKLDSSIIKAAKDSTAIKEKIRSNIDAIINNNVKNKKITDISIEENNELQTVLGRTHIYDPKIDNKGNLDMYIIDWYDFSLMKDDGSTTAIINNNAYKTQKKGGLTNYVLILKMQYTPKELEDLLK